MTRCKVEEMTMPSSDVREWSATLPSCSFDDIEHDDLAHGLIFLQACLGAYLLVRIFHTGGHLIAQEIFNGD